jgi:hypothetical protein
MPNSPRQQSRAQTRQIPPANESEAQRINRALAEAAQEAEARQADETVPGGQYEVMGQLFNAAGEPLDEQKPHPTDEEDAEPPPPPLRDTPPPPPNPTVSPEPPEEPRNSERETD